MAQWCQLVPEGSRSPFHVPAMFLLCCPSPGSQHSVLYFSSAHSLGFIFLD